MLKKDRVKILVLKGMRGSCEVRQALTVLYRSLPRPIIVEMRMALWFTSSDIKFQR